MQKRNLKIIVASIFVVIIGSVIFIKTNTGLAAEFTDNFLRPFFGNRIVGFLEKIYFNTSDKIEKISNKNSSAPVFGLSGTESLTLSPISLPNYFSALKNEGVWIDKPLLQFPGKNIFSYTFVRPDPDRPYAFVTLAQISMGSLDLGITAGTKEPGGKIGNPGSGVIPGEIVKNGKLVAAFDGGFQYRDGKYGMIVNGKTYVPLENGIGTLVGYKNGDLKILTYNGQDLGNNISFIRQNCPILIENGQVFAENEKDKKLWGRTFNADIFTWRSGIGLTKEGNLIYAVGNNLSPQSLATALKMAGAENAIQLDINPFWVRFNIFEPNGNGSYKSTTLTKELKDGSKDYLNGYSKDFFYVYSKQ